MKSVKTWELLLFPELTKRLLAKVIAVFVILAFFESPGSAQTLIFQTGFEPSSTADDYTALTDITGTDYSLPSRNSWNSHLESYPKIGDFNLNYVGGVISDRWARIVNDPTGGNNKVLHFWQQRVIGSPRSRIQTQVYNNDNLTEFTERMRVYIHPDMDLLKTYDGDVRHWMIKELWVQPNWQGLSNPYRIHLKIYKDKNEDKFYWHIASEIGESPFDEMYSNDNNTIPVPIGEWFDTEFYYKKGDEDSGHLSFRINPQRSSWVTIFDEKARTYHPNSNGQNLWGWNPMKMYLAKIELTDHIRTKGGAAQMFWDDWKLWDGDARTASVSNIINKKYKENSITIYPNPTNDKLRIDLIDSLGGNIQVFSVSGRVVYEQTFSGASHEFDIKNYINRGICFVKVISELEIINSKIVVQ